MSKTIFSKKSMLFFSVLVLLFSSCSKDDAVSPDYVGTWSSTSTESGMSIKENMTFTTDGVTQLSQMSIPTTNIWIDFLKATATISVNGSTMTTTFTGIGYRYGGALHDRTAGRRPTAQDAAGQRSPAAARFFQRLHLARRTRPTPGCVVAQG